MVNGFRSGFLNSENAQSSDESDDDDMPPQLIDYDEDIDSEEVDSLPELIDNDEDDDTDNDELPPLDNTSEEDFNDMPELSESDDDEIDLDAPPLIDDDSDDDNDDDSSCPSLTNSSDSDDYDDDLPDLSSSDESDYYGTEDGLPLLIESDTDTDTNSFEEDSSYESGDDSYDGTSNFGRGPSFFDLLDEPGGENMPHHHYHSHQQNSDQYGVKLTTESDGMITRYFPSTRIRTILTNRYTQANDQVVFYKETQAIREALQAAFIKRNTTVIVTLFFIIHLAISADRPV
jgi:hypothetical protein